MPDRDKNQQQQDQQPSQAVAKASKFVDNPLVQYAGGVAAAALTKRGIRYALRSRYVGNFATAAVRTMAYMGRNGSSKAIEDMSFKEMRNYMATLKEALHRSKENMQELRIRDANRTVVGALKRQHNMESSAGAGVMALKNFRENDLLPEVEEMIREQKFDHATEQHLLGFANRVAKDPFNDLRVHDAMESHGLMNQGEAGLFADNILEHMRERTEAFKASDGMGVSEFKRRKAEIVDSLSKAGEQELGTIEGLERFLGTANEKNRSFMDRMLEGIVGNRAGTMGDLIRLIKEGKVKDQTIGPKNNQLSINQEILKLDEKFREQGEEAHNRFLNLLPDERGFRIGRNGEAFTNSDVSDLDQKFLNAAANTLPGQILKVRELENVGRAPSLMYVNAGSNDPLFHAALKGIGEEGKDAIRYENGDVYTVQEDGSLKFVTPELEEKGIYLDIDSGKHGLYHSLVTAITGQSKIRDTKNSFRNLFEIGTDGEKYKGSILKRIGSIFTKSSDPNFRGNIAKRLRNPSLEDDDEFNLAVGDASNLQDEMMDGGKEWKADRLLRHYIGDVNKMYEIMNENSHTLTPEILRALDAVIPKETKKAGEDNRARGLLDLLVSGKSGMEMMRELTEDTSLHVPGSENPKNHISPFLSENLASFHARFERDEQEAANVLNQATDRAKLGIGSSLSDVLLAKYNNEHLGIDEIAQKTIAQELILSLGRKSEKEEAKAAENAADAILDSLDRKSAPVSYDKIHEVLDKVMGHLDRRNAEELDTLAETTIFTHHTSPSALLDTPKTYRYYARNAKEMFTGEEEYQKKFQAAFDRTIEDEVSSLEQNYVDEDNYAGKPLADFISIRKAITPSDILSNLNNTTKAKAMLKSMFKQVTASGVQNPEDVTRGTLLPLFFMKRLSDDLNEAVGLGLDGSSFTSVPRAIRDIALKRVLPVALVYQYGDWADDTSQELTGTSITGAAANGIANVDLAVRKTISALGMDDWLKEEKSINPIWQYWFDHDDYQGYDERREYYRNGYSPVRKAAWWTFGGVGEARGGEIQYWQPSFVRRINSDYKDKSLYSSYWDKWSHSWLPTPTNPLSPIFAFMNPYHLEEEHEDDRPYALSGPLFEEGTPWGAILNPTLGRILKPEKELHPYRFRNGVDAKSLVHQINLSIKQAARDLTDTNDILIDGSSFTPVGYTNYNAPTEDTKVMLYQINQNGNGILSTGVYGGVGGTGGAGLAGSGTGGGGTGAGAWGLGGFSNNLQNGYNPLQPNEAGAKELDRVGEHNRPGIREALRDIVYGGGYATVHDGDLITNNKGEAGTYSQRPRGAKDLSFEEKLAVGSRVNDGIIGEAEEAILDVAKRINPKAIIRGSNDEIKAQAAQKADVPYAVDDDDGFTNNLKLSSFRPSQAMELLNDPETVTDLVNAGKGSDFVRDVTSSWRLIGGIYGYAGAKAMGIGVYEDKRLAKSSDMDTYSRGFWDENFGGLGGNVADIIHRFIPDFKRLRRVNPLMNDMPDWMPERFRYGDPYTAIPKGEMRLPGRGYESLNQLHPDQFGTYGAYDRMKILADIDPFSPEYRMWRQIAQKTVTDPALIEDMNNIRQRVIQQGKKHDFYNYKVLGHGLHYENIEVSEVLGYGKFRSGQTIYKIAGVSVKSAPGLSMQETLGKYLKPGMDITIAVDSDDAYNINKDAQKSVNAAVYIDGANLANEMLEAGDATKRKGDTSAPAILGNMSSMQVLIAGASELVAHMDIPWISDQFLRVRSPYESYKAEQVYGTPYQSWDHPISTFLLPAIERSIYTRDALDNVLNVVYHAAVDQHAFGHLGKDARHAVQAAHFFSNRASFIGAAMANLIDVGNGTLTNKFDRKMNTFVTGAHFLTGGNSYTDEMTSGAMIGYDIAKKMEDDLIETGSKTAEKDLERFKAIRGKGALIGAGIGAAYRLFTGRSGKEYIPERTQKKWDTEDYFDRLTYLKYMGLYEQAARMAEKEDGVDVKAVIKAAEHRAEINRARIKKYQNLKKELKLSNDSRTDPEKDELNKILTNKINALANEPARLVDGSKWAISALVYKNAAEATMQGLKKDSSWSQIVTALPTNDREYFMEFVKERDEDKRRKIMRISSPALQKALMLAWGKTKSDKSDSEKMAENQQYFQHHYLPTADWEGWRPDVDLKDVEVKTIANEAQNLSDFGFYESQLRDPKTVAAPDLPHDRANRGVDIRRELKRILQGKGLRNVNVDVTESATLSTTQIKADIKTYTSGRQKQKMINRSIADQNRT